MRTSCGRILAQSLPLAGEIVQQILLECRRIRTSDLRLQRPTLYPTELQPQSGESGRPDLNRRPLAPPNRRVTRLRHSPTAAIRRSCPSSAKWCRRDKSPPSAVERFGPRLQWQGDRTRTRNLRSWRPLLCLLSCTPAMKAIRPFGRSPWRAYLQLPHHVP